MVTNEETKSTKAEDEEDEEEEEKEMDISVMTSKVRGNDIRVIGRYCNGRS